MAPITAPTMPPQSNLSVSLMPNMLWKIQKPTRASNRPSPAEVNHDLKPRMCRKASSGIRARAIAPATKPSAKAARKLIAQPTEDPADPLVILSDLPEPEREEFLRQYHQAVDAAHDPAGYQLLQRLLHISSLTAVAAGQPGYYEELAVARAGTTTTVPVTDVIPDWAERVAAAKDRR